MTLELLYLAGCPNHEATVELVQRVLGAEGMAVEVRQTLICNHEEANAHGFPGVAYGAGERKGHREACRGSTRRGLCLPDLFCGWKSAGCAAALLA